ncbi:MAG TPA: ATP-grasp domain-containing protein [Gemmatimonadaceae bacterium]|nr:ATP-grasp domain-containing protein [Gemmatimonadaceae bacterium]
MKVVLLHTADAEGPPRDPVIEQLLEAIRGHGHDVAPLVVDRSVEPVVAALRRHEPDLVFNLAESFGGKSALESNVAALLNLLDLRYTGSSPAGLMLAGDKALAKKVLSFHGVKTPQFAAVFRGAVDWADDIAFPVIIKPPQEDASIGVSSASVVTDIRQLLERIDAIYSEFQQPALVEQFVDGREFYVGVLGNESATPLPIIELDFSGFPAGRPRIASWEAKWGDDGEGSGAEFAGTRSIFPRDIAPDLVERIQQVAVEAFNALRLRDYARIDLRVTDADEIYVIEVNPNCYLERESEFARAAAAADMGYEKLVGRIIELALARYAR